MKTGFTLIETLVTLSILAILGAVSLSFMQGFVFQNRHSVEVRKLVSALQYARMIAIRQGETTIFCGSRDFKLCDGDWQSGQIIKQNEQVVRIFTGSHPGERWEWRSSLGKNHQIEFSALGFTRGQQGSFYYYKGSERLYRIILSHTGAIRVEAFQVKKS